MMHLAVLIDGACWQILHAVGSDDPETWSEYLIGMSYPDCILHPALSPGESAYSCAHFRKLSCLAAVVCQDRQS
jgi:hypothetical protein